MWCFKKKGLCLTNYVTRVVCQVSTRQASRRCVGVGWKRSGSGPMLYHPPPASNFGPKSSKDWVISISSPRVQKTSMPSSRETRAHGRCVQVGAGVGQPATWDMLSVAQRVLRTQGNVGGCAGGLMRTLWSRRMRRKLKLRPPSTKKTDQVCAPTRRTLQTVEYAWAIACLQHLMLGRISTGSWHTSMLRILMNE